MIPNEDYYWISGDSTGGNIKAKNMKEACIEAMKEQIPARLDKFDKKKLYFDKLKVVKGKLPKYF